MLVSVADVVLTTRVGRRAEDQLRLAETLE
jgi:hypothetical protein